MEQFFLAIVYLGLGMAIASLAQMPYASRPMDASLARRRFDQKMSRARGFMALAVIFIVVGIIGHLVSIW